MKRKIRFFSAEGDETADNPPLRTMNDIKPRAVVLGTAAFALLYFLHVLILPLLDASIDLGKGGAMMAVSQMLGVATCVIPGYVSARISGERGFFYGFNVGGLGTVLSALAAILWSLATGAMLPGLGLAALPFWIFVNGSLSGFAGLMATDMIDEGRRER